MREIDFIKKQVIFSGADSKSLIIQSKTDGIDDTKTKPAFGLRSVLSDKEFDASMYLDNNGNIVFAAPTNEIFLNNMKILTSIDKKEFDSNFSNIENKFNAVNNKFENIKSEMNTINLKIESTNNSIPKTDASESISGFMSANDKRKLNSIEHGANKYIHPSTHPASMITEENNRRFVTDSQINMWNRVSDKVDKVYGKGLSTNDFTDYYKNKLNNASTGGEYSHPSTHPASMITISNSNMKSSTVEGAIGELFQFAGKGKEIISNSVGKPLSASDDFFTLGSKILDLKSDLASKINNKGGSAPGGYGVYLKNLIQAIDTIPGQNVCPPPGKKFFVFQGEKPVRSWGTHDDEGTCIDFKEVVSFKPSALILFMESYGKGYSAQGAMLLTRSSTKILLGKKIKRIAFYESRDIELTDNGFTGIDICLEGQFCENYKIKYILIE